MNIVIDLIILACLAAYLVQGFRRGAFLSLLGLLSIVCSYAGAILFSRNAGAWIANTWGWDPLTARIYGGAAIFFFIGIAFAILQRVARAIMMKKGDDGRKRLVLAPSSRVVGGLMSASIAVLLLTAGWWAYDAMRATPMGEKLPSLEGSATASIGGAIARGVAGLAIGDRLPDDRAAKVATLIGAPGDAAIKIRAFLNEPAMQAVFESKDFRDAFVSGEREAIAANPEYLALFNDEAATTHMRDLGFISAEEPIDEVRDNLAGQLARAGSSLSKILEDPEVKASVEEMKEEKAFENPDWPALAFDRRIRTIAARAMEAMEATEEEEEEEPKNEAMRRGPGSLQASHAFDRPHVFDDLIAANKHS